MEDGSTVVGHHNILAGYKAALLQAAVKSVHPVHGRLRGSLIENADHR
jgi:hypothetical protein